MALLLALVVAAAMPVAAQDAEGANDPINVKLDDATGSMSIKQEVTTMADVELTVGVRVYRLRVPVTVQIDTETALADADIAAPAANHVGVFLIEPVEMEIFEEVYEKDYRTITPSNDENVVVVYRADVTNMHNSTLEANYTSVMKALAIDDAGNTYEEEERICDDIDPGETLTCEYVFDVPATANLVDLQVEAVAYKTFSFEAAAE